MYFDFFVQELIREVEVPWQGTRKWHPPIFLVQFI